MAAFDSAPDRPEEIDQILNGLDRYNPDATVALQDYVTFQCKNRTYDLYANLALLKLYQFNPLQMREKVVTNVLAKSLISFGEPDFSLCLALLPPNTLIPPSDQTSEPSPLSGAVQKLNNLNNLLSTARYATFWSTLSNDTLYQDLVSEVDGFNELVRVRIALAITQSARRLAVDTVESWLFLKGPEFLSFVEEECGWSIADGIVEVPVNSENEVKSLFVRESVKFNQFGRIVRRSLEHNA